MEQMTKDVWRDMWQDTKDAVREVAAILMLLGLLVTATVLMSITDTQAGMYGVFGLLGVGGIAIAIWEDFRRRKQQKVADMRHACMCKEKEGI